MRELSPCQAKQFVSDLGFLLSEFNRSQKYVPVIGTLNFVNPDLTSSGDDNLTRIS